jgi:hypothetical protein
VSLPAELLSLFVYGLNTSAGIVAFNAPLQDAVPHRIRGRVFTLLAIARDAMRLASLAVGGLPVDATGIQSLYSGGGLLLLVAGLIGPVLAAPGNR